MNTLNLAINLDTYFSKPDCDSYKIRKKLSKATDENDKTELVTLIVLTKCQDY